MKNPAARGFMVALKFLSHQRFFVYDKTNSFFLSATFRRRFSNKIHAFAWAIFLWKKNEIEFSTRIFIQSEHFFVRSKVKPIRKNFLISCRKKNYLNYWSEQRKLWIKDSNRRRNIWNNTVCLCTARYPKQRRRKKNLQFILCDLLYVDARTIGAPIKPSK